MKTILLRPNGHSTYQSSINHLRAVEPPIYLLTLTKYYKSDIIIDAEAEEYTEQETVEEVKKHKPDRIIILATGTHPSAYIQQREIATKLDLLLTEANLNVITYNKLPILPCKTGTLNWSLIDLNKYKAHNWHCFGGLNRSPYGAIFTSTSCPFNCTFCCIKDFYGDTYQERLISTVTKDLRGLAKRGVSNIKILDELFVYKPQRVISVCDYIITEGYKFNIWAYARIDIMNDSLLKKMKKAGINWLAYGIESGNDEIRRKAMKGNFTKDKIRDVIKMTKDNGINCLGNYMFGFWEDSLDSMQETLDFSLELNCEYANFYNVVAYPGSKLNSEMKDKKVSLPINYKEYGQMSENFKPLPTKTLLMQKVLSFRDNAFKQYFTNSKYLNMIKNKFGESTVKEIKEMTSISLKRKYNNDNSQ